VSIGHIELVQYERNYRFKITPVGGPISKVDRIRRLIPLFKRRAASSCRPAASRLTSSPCSWRRRFMGFPVAEHDDALEALARIADPDITPRWPLSDLEKALRGSQRPDSYLYKNGKKPPPGNLWARQRARTGRHPAAQQPGPGKEWR
jgi:hypothetical protein